MVDFLGCVGYLEEVYSFIKVMFIELDSSIWFCFLFVLRIYYNLEFGILFVEKLLRMELERGGNYVQLINFYMEVGLKKEVVNLLREMKEKGLQKNLGCSWIEVSNFIYVFFLGGFLFLMMFEIFNVLNSLKSNMIDEDEVI